MEIVLASKNKHKINEFQQILKGYLPDIKVLSLADVDFQGEIDENGDTFEENAKIKAQAIAELGYIGVGDDSGLSVEALFGAPGISSARYAGEHGNDAANNEKLLFEMRDKEDRSAAFVCVIACAFPKGEYSECDFCVRGEAKGKILNELCGEGGFGYDPLFYVEEYKKTFAELSSDEKNSISHRGRAVELFAERLCEIIKNQDKTEKK